MKAGKTLYIILTGLFSLTLLQCDKPSITLHHQSYSTPADVPLHAIQFVSSDTGFAVGGNRFHKGCFLKSVDGGKNWKKDSIVNYAAYDLHFFDGKNGYVVAYTGKLFNTTNGGNHWRLYQDPTWTGLMAVDFINRQVGFAVGGNVIDTSAFIKTFNSGNNWSSRYIQRDMRDIHFFNNKTGVVAGYGAILRTEDAGESWSFTNAKDDFFQAFSFPSGSTGFVVGHTGVVLKTTDRGENWTKVRKGNSPLPERKHFFDIAFWNNETGYIIGERGTIIYTNNGGENWYSLDAFTEEELRCIWLTGKYEGWVGGNTGSIYRFTVKAS